MLKTLYPHEINAMPLYAGLHLEEEMWQATRIFCQGLDPMKALKRSLYFLKRSMPADAVLCNFLHLSTNNSPYFLFGDNIEVYSKESEVFIHQDHRKTIFAKKGSYIQLCQDDDEVPMVQKFMSLLPRDHYSFLVFRSMLNEDTTIGTFTVAAKGHGRYTDTHISYLFSLRNIIEIFFTNLYEYYTTLQQNRTLVRSNSILRHSANADKLDLEKLPGLASVVQQIRQVAPLDCPVLLLGETGVGKEAVADALHEHSDRCLAPYVKVNCGAVPETLVDSELFGHEKGAFSGAHAHHVGRFERAHNGTLLLDEIGELPLSIQARLLRVLQFGEMDRVGGSKTIYVNVRILAATHNDLLSRSREGSFREDLFYRLNVFPITIPPLRRRPEDIPVLAEYFITQFVRRAGTLQPSLEHGFFERLQEFSWPGNVRQLRNTLEQSFILWLTDPESPFVPRLPSEKTTRLAQDVRSSAFLTLDEVMIRHIKDALIRSKGKIHGPGGAAEMLGMNPCTLRSRMMKFHIPFGSAASLYGRQ